MPEKYLDLTGLSHFLDKLDDRYVDKTSAQTIGGTKTFTSRPRSVEVYTKLAYIQSNAGSGFPYIRTGVLRDVHYTNKLTCVLDGYFTESQTYGFCGYDSGGQLGQKSGKWSTENDGLGTTNVNCIGSSNRATVTQVLDFTANNNKLYINGTMVAGRSINNADYSRQTDYPLFVAYAGTYTYNPAKLVLYSFKMYAGDTTGTLIRDFIPVRNSSNEIGLLDLVEGKFYRNQGTTAFTAGSDVETVTVGGPLLTSSDVGVAALTNSYNDLDNKPTIPTVNNATLTIQKNGTTVNTFTANASTDVTANITVPTKDSDLTNDRYVRYDVNSQGLSDTQKSNARTNIGAGTSSLTLGSTSSTAAYGNHLYHYWTTNQYYVDSYSGEKNWRMMTENVLADTLRWKAGTIANKEYYDYTNSTWVSSSVDYSNLFNGNYGDGVDITYAQRKFRFTMTANSGWGTTTMLCLEGSWYDAGTVNKITGTDYYVIVTIETRASTSDSWATKVTANFTSNCMNKLALCVPSSALHTGHTLYRITVELAPWTNTSKSASLRRLMILSNYAGSSLTPFSYNGSGKVTAMNTLNATTLQEGGTNLSSKYYLATNPNGYTSNTGTVIGSDLTADQIVLGNSGVNIKISSYKPSSSSTTWNASSDVYIPTMKSISSYVTTQIETAITTTLNTPV